MNVLLALLYPVVVDSSLKPGTAFVIRCHHDDDVDLDYGEYNDHNDEDDDDENVHLREMDRWPGLLSDSLDISEYTQTPIIC